MLFLQPVPYFLSENSHFYFCSSSGPRTQVPAFCSGKSSSEVADPVELVYPCWMGTPRADLRAWPWMNPGVSKGLGGGAGSRTLAKDSPLLPGGLTRDVSVGRALQPHRVPSWFQSQEMCSVGPERAG